MPRFFPHQITILQVLALTICLWKHYDGFSLQTRLWVTISSGTLFWIMLFRILMPGIKGTVQLRFQTSFLVYILTPLAIQFAKAISNHSPHPTPPNILFTIFYYLPPKDSSPYNSFSPTIPPISIPPIYYHSLTNYLFNVFKFKKIIQYLCCHNTHYHHITELKRN